MKFCIVMAEGFEETEFTAVYDVFVRAGIETDVFSLSGPAITSSHGLHYTGFKDAAALVKEDYDLMFMPGGRKNYDVLVNSPLVKELCVWYLENRSLAAICAAPAVIGNAGLLKGKNYTCFTGFQKEEFEGFYKDQYYVADGNLYTGRSMAASLDFALMVVEHMCGKETADKIRGEIIY